ncbi:hypothetical protein [Collimonas fungivorans]|uniref:hypothetical protein n=1 Tax=Collimonas fungivorans TaxID=158899 RepID=UPI0007782F31|nr:hypothetical protein [Collimonas fungivorans]
MAQSRQEAAGSLDHMLLANVLSILERQVGTGELSFRAAYDIYVAIAKDLRVALSIKELEDTGHRLEAAELKMPDM